MTKLLFAYASLAFVVAGAPMMVAAPAQAAANPAVGYCKELITLPGFEGLSLGQCVSEFNAENNYFGKGTGNSQAVAVHVCDYWQVVDPTFYDSMFTSEQECRDFVLTLL
jgi:hypothetical protein